MPIRRTLFDWTSGEQPAITESTIAIGRIDSASIDRE
jgi:hypothetical protein